MPRRSRPTSTRREGDGADIQAAADWMARLLADDVTEQDRIACQRWRDQDPRNERIWQRMCQISGKFSSMSVGAGGTEILERTHHAVVSRRRFLSLSALLGLGVTATWLGTPHTQLGRSRLAQYRTVVGETRAFTLEDGTRLILNTDSAVDVDFSSRERRIQLHQGEILVMTGKESPRRHFVVDTRFGQLVALGTEFNVRQCADYAHVAVLEGAVEAHAAKGGLAQKVGAGQQARFNITRIDAPAPLQTTAISWHLGRLVAHGMRLSDVVEEIARYRPGFTLYDPTVADLTVSGVFSLQDTDRALQSLVNSLPVALNYRTAYWVKVVPAS